MEQPPRLFVSASAVGYYGSRGDEVLTEQSPPGDDFVADLVVAWEAAAQPAIDAGIRTVFLRTAPVLSSRGGILPQMALPFRLFVGGRIGSGRQWMSWVSLDDVIGVVHHVVDHDELVGPRQRDRTRARHGTSISPRRSAGPSIAPRWCRSPRRRCGSCSAAVAPSRCCSPASGCTPRC